MKKNLILSLVVAGVMGLMLTGCGNKPEKVTVEVEQSQEAGAEEQPLVDEEPTVEATEPTEEVEATEEEPTTEATEVVEVEVPEQEVDYLAENGIEITPCGEMVMPMGITGTDDLQDVNVVNSIEVVPAEEGYVNTIFKSVVEIPQNAFSLNLEPYDRYTGNLLHLTNYTFGVEGGSAQEGYSVEVDGVTYDCKYSCDWVMVDDRHYESTVTVHHPEEYDGVVFQMGEFTASMKTVTNGIDDTQPRKLMDYPELLEGQYYFTATDN